MKSLKCDGCNYSCELITNLPIYPDCPGALNDKRDWIEQEVKCGGGVEGQPEIDIRVPELYWKHRCEAAEEFIAKSPGDPDVNSEQIKAYAYWKRFLDIKPETYAG